MEYISNVRFEMLTNKYEKLIIFNGISTFIFVIFPFCFVFLFENGVVNNKFWYFESGIFIINLITFLGFYRKGKLFNNTIKKIEIVDEDLIFETFRFHILKVWCLPQKKVRVKLSDLKIFPVKYPLRNKNKEIDKSCFVIKNGANDFYFLNNYFEDELRGKLMSNR